MFPGIGQSPITCAVQLRLTVERPQPRSQRPPTWRLTIPLLPRLSDAIWAALRRLME